MHGGGHGGRRCSTAMPCPLTECTPGAERRAGKRSLRYGPLKSSADETMKAVRGLSSVPCWPRAPQLEVPARLLPPLPYVIMTVFMFGAAEGAFAPKNRAELQDGAFHCIGECASGGTAAYEHPDSPETRFCPDIDADWNKGTGICKTASDPIPSGQGSGTYGAIQSWDVSRVNNMYRCELSFCYCCSCHSCCTNNVVRKNPERTRKEPRKNPLSHRPLLILSRPLFRPLPRTFLDNFYVFLFFQVFDNAAFFNQPLEGWNVANVTNMAFSEFNRISRV